MSQEIDDTSISSHLGFAASRWRADLPPRFDDQNITLQYIGTPYTPENQSPGQPPGDLTNLYGKIFWETYFEALFPSINNSDFLNEKSTGVPGGYFTQLYKIAALDFYDSYFRGRDDLGSNSAGQVMLPPYSGWTSLTDNEKKLVIKRYFYSRSDFVDVTKEFSDRMLLNHMNLRSINVFYYVAQLMVGVMSEMQANTINAGRYATRLAQTQKAISTEMMKTTYLYKTLLNSSDYGTINTNENNGAKLEALRMNRSRVQKETDQASSFLESSQRAVEEQGSKALEFLKKGQEMTNLFFKNF